MKRTNTIAITLDPSLVEFDEETYETLEDTISNDRKLLAEHVENWLRLLDTSLTEAEQQNYLLIDTRIKHIVNSMRLHADFLEHLGIMTSKAQARTLEAIVRNTKPNNHGKTKGNVA